MGRGVGIGVGMGVGIGLELAWGQVWQLEMVWEMVSGWPPELEAPALMLGERREWPWAGV